MNQSVWEILNGAGFAMWAILGMSILALAIGFERALVQWKFSARSRALADTVQRSLGRGALEDARSACERSPSPLADVFLVGYARMGRTSYEKVASAVNRERLRVAADFKKRLWMLGTIGALAPFVGLFGTVIGIMFAFADIAESGAGGIEVVAPGISEALYATAAGIFVAIEAVIIYNYFNQRLARAALEMKMHTEEFLELLEEQGPPAPLRGQKRQEDDNGNRSAA